MIELPIQLVKNSEGVLKYGFQIVSLTICGQSDQILDWRMHLTHGIRESLYKVNMRIVRS